MENKVISIEIGRDFNYIISMYKDAIQSIVYVPRDYKTEEIIDVMLHATPVDSPEDIVCYDVNGFGIMIKDELEKSSLKILSKPMTNKEVVDSAVALDLAKIKLLDVSTRRNLSGFEFLEFKKLCDEVYNLELKQKGTNLRLSKKDESIGHTRASCYLQGLYVLMNNK